MDIAAVLGISKSVVTLSEKLVHLVESTRAEGRSPRLTEIVSSLESEATKTCLELREELRSINAELSASRIDVDQSVSDLHSDLRWFNFRTRSKLRTFESRFHGLYESLSSFTDDIVSVMICAQSTDSLETALRESSELQRQLDSVLHSDRTLREILDEISKVADAIYKRMRGGPKDRGPDRGSPAQGPGGGGESKRKDRNVSAGIARASEIRSSEDEEFEEPPESFQWEAEQEPEATQQVHLRQLRTRY